MRKLVITFFVLCLGILKSFAMDWGGTESIITAMLQHYEMHPNYHAVIVDQWLHTDGTTENVGDTISAYKYEQYGYLSNGNHVQVFTPAHDIFIDRSSQVMSVRSVSLDDIKKIEQMMPTAASTFQAFAQCDSARIISVINGETTIDFFITNSLINRSRIIIGSNGWIKEIWRYYTTPQDIIAQRTKFVVMDILSNANISQFNESNYITPSANTFVPAAAYQNYSINVE